MAFTEVLFNWTTFAFSKVIFWHDYFYSVLLREHADVDLCLF